MTSNKTRNKNLQKLLFLQLRANFFTFNALNVIFLQVSCCQAFENIIITYQLTLPTIREKLMKLHTKASFLVKWKTFFSDDGILLFSREKHFPGEILRKLKCRKSNWANRKKVKEKILIQNPWSSNLRVKKIDLNPLQSKRANKYAQIWSVYNLLTKFGVGLHWGLPYVLLLVNIESLRYTTL